MSGVRSGSGYRQTWAEVSLQAIAENTRAFKSILAGNGGRCQLMAVVKADGYGHGAVQTAMAAMRGGADRLGVAFVDEAIALRDGGVEAPILVLGYTPPEAIAAAVEHNVAVTVFTAEGVKAAAAAAERLGIPAALHLKVDTGMNRLGVRSAEEALELALLAVATSPSWLKLEGVFTHFAQADRPDTEFTRRQFDRFMEVIRLLEGHGISIPLRHCCNTDGTASYPEMHLDMVRVGIGLYGGGAGAAPVLKSRLRATMSLRSRISALIQLDSGESVGYGCAYVVDRRSILAVLPIGYADGLSRSLSNRGTVAVAGGFAPVRGRVCMDQMMIDVTDLPDSVVGDEAVIFGDPRKGVPGADDIAVLLGTIDYEVFCSVSKRVPRVYVD
ncbi:alanine racemase [Paenibacillus koleovorans]|uniref:alanine racemase n=1 Tax=Paenibacillus koleovorans TaxID=121608 RepID=UPI000FDBC169|nr:alanine racemase [Paenibacillus koleovorans]